MGEAVFGYADGISDGEEGALAEVWEGIRFAFSGPRRKGRDGSSFSVARSP